MYFEDLTPYAYTEIRLPSDMPLLLNFGWLDTDHDYTRGQVDSSVVEHLLGLAPEYANRMRGFHCCPFCGDGKQVVMYLSGQPVYLGNAEIHITAGDATYVAPSLLPHYIDLHGYRPPEVVLGALLQEGDEKSPPGGCGTSPSLGPPFLH